MGLRLDTEMGVYATLKDYDDRYVITLGKPELSELYLRISSRDSSEMMPTLPRGTCGQSVCESFVVLV